MSVHRGGIIGVLGHSLVGHHKLLLDGQKLLKGSSLHAYVIVMQVFVEEFTHSDLSNHFGKNCQN